MRTKKLNKKPNLIHHTRRTRDSNIITTFIDNNQNKFNLCSKFSKKSSNLNYIYNYFDEHYRKYHLIPKDFINETILPVNQKLDIYLDNIAYGDIFRTKKEFKSKLELIFSLLVEKYRSLLEDMFQILLFSEEEQKEILDFGNKISNNEVEEEEFIEWFNYNGKKLARGIYIFILDRKFPKEISDLIGLTPDIYGEFTSLDIQKDIELNLEYGVKQEYICDGIKLNLNVYSYHSGYNPSSKLLDRIFFLSYIEKSPEINLTLWLADKKKKLKYGRKHRYIGPKEINSGCTSYVDSVRNISVWRKEELEKVVAHELVHSLDMEDRMNTIDLENFVFQHFDIQRSLNKLTIFENYVEVVADILNVFFLVQETFNQSEKKGKQKNTVKKTKKKKLKPEKMKMFYDIIWLEKCWSMFQAAKILNYFRYLKFEDFYNKEGIGEDAKTSKYQQKSNVFSYIILRSITMFRLNKFLELCREFEDDNILHYNIPNERIISFWRDVLDNSNYIKQMNKLIDMVREVEKKKNVSAVVFQSMRMTCVESK